MRQFLRHDHHLSRYKAHIVVSLHEMCVVLSKMADMSSNNTSTINLDKNVPLPEESNETTTTKCSNLIFDGTTYHWIGNLIELKAMQ